jgi:hypothetical protein
MNSANLFGTRTVSRLCPKFVLTLFSASHLHPLLIFFLLIQTDLLQVGPIFLSFLLLRTLATIFAACARRLLFLVTSVKYLSHSPFSYMLLISCVINPRPCSPNRLSTSPGTSSSLSVLSLISLKALWLLVLSNIYSSEKKVYAN